jgi:mRNA deadenylase 3'-5' endonuclease subunit Ccr4
MSTEEQKNPQNKIEENNNNTTSTEETHEVYQIISQKPFPFNIRDWYPEIELEKIIEKISNTQYPIRIVQYNILCDSLLPISTRIIEEDLKKLPHLSWENRAKKIIEELKTLNGDLISLTELENDVNFMRELNNAGYELGFKPRTGKHSEGCAIAWKEEKFEMIDLLSIAFNMNKDGNNQNDIYSRDNIALIGIFKIKNKENSIILFATSQLLFNVKRGDIKLGQCYQIVNALEELRKKYEDELKNKVYIIFASDLNCVPKSGVYKLLTTGELNCNQINKIHISGQDMDNLQYANPPVKIKNFLLRGILKNYCEEPKKNNYYKNNFNYKDYNSNKESGLPPQENVHWYNDLCRINPVISNHSITLEYKDKYIHQDVDLILKLPFVFKSVYATIAKNALDYFNDKYKDIPFNLLEDFSQTEINGIKISKKELEKTNDFTKSLTMENVVSYYSNDTISSLDYIFYYSKNNECKVARILKAPDLFKLCFDIGYMPNEIFPSDHLSIAADLILC